MFKVEFSEFFSQIAFRLKDFTQPTEYIEAFQNLIYIYKDHQIYKSHLFN